MYDIRRKIRSASHQYSINKHHSSCLKGKITHQSKQYDEQNILIFDREGEVLEFKTSDNFKALLLNGEPIDDDFCS